MNRSDDDRLMGRVLVMMPGTLAEAVMATALLASLRAAYPEAHITALVRRRLRPVLWGLDSVDRVVSVRRRKRRRAGSHNERERVSVVRLGRRLSRGGFDTAIILPGSFKAAALAAVAGIPRRIGYEREGRAVLLTDRLVHRRHRGSFVPVPLLDHYLGIARYLGATAPTPAIRLQAHPAAQAALDQRLASAGVDTQAGTLLLTVTAPAGKNGASATESTDALARELQARHRLQPVTARYADPHKGRRNTHAQAPAPAHAAQGTDLGDLSADLHQLKALIARSWRVVSADPGVRSLAEAMGVPAVGPGGDTARDASPVEAGLIHTAGPQAAAPVDRVEAGA